MNTMTLSTSTLLVAVGAIMRYAISVKDDGFNVPVIGAILMVVGIVGAVISIALFIGTNRRRVTPVAVPATVLAEERNVR